MNTLTRDDLNRTQSMTPAEIITNAPVFARTSYMANLLKVALTDGQVSGPGAKNPYTEGTMEHIAFSFAQRYAAEKRLRQAAQAELIANPVAVEAADE